MSIETLDQPPTGWHALDVVPSSSDKWNWVALMIDVNPDELKHCLCKVAFLYVHPKEYKPDKGRIANEVWVRIPGKHKNVESARDALTDLLATRH
jgi:hypothetical protein